MGGGVLMRHGNILSKVFGQTKLALYFSFGGNLGGKRGNLSSGGLQIVQKVYPHPCG